MNSPLTGLQLAPQWRGPLLAVVVLVAALTLVYSSTLMSMVDIWSRSDTFAHGFIIAPVSLWLIWQLRGDLAPMTPRVEPWFILPMIAVGLVWLMSWLVDVMVTRQLAFVFLLIFGVFALLGTEVARMLLFPMAFLLFMVPMGENLIAPMMDFTAVSTVWLLRQTGIPVYQEGLFFSLPSGDWSVVEACSGIRYLIAAVTLGCLYAYLIYRSLTKRLLFVLAAVIIPVFANTLRAYIIVLLGHYSGMTLAVGVDHLIYGWVFFGFVIFLMFLVGSFFRDNSPSDQLPPDELSSAPTATVASGTANVSRPQHRMSAGSSLYGTALLIVAAALVWPLVPTVLPEAKAGSDDAVLVFPPVADGWQEQSDPGWNWAPLGAGADLRHQSFYTREGAMVGLYINQYLNQSQGSELVNSLDQWIIPDLKDYRWHLLNQGSAQMQINNQKIRVEQARIKSPQGELLLWRWYRIGHRDTANPYVAKVLEALAKLSFSLAPAVRIYLVTPVWDSVELSAGNLQSFVDQLAPQLDVALNARQEVF